MNASTSAEHAYARAHGELVRLLAAAPDPTALASEVLGVLQRQGWKWVRREDPPPRGRASDPREHPDYLAAEEALREANRRRAEEEGATP